MKEKVSVDITSSVAKLCWSKFKRLVSRRALYQDAGTKGKKGSEAEVAGPAAAIRAHRSSEVTYTSRDSSCMGKQKCGRAKGL